MSELGSSRYPESASERDRWIVARRGSRENVTADQPYAFLLEQERFASGEIGLVATIFLTNRECPWRCAMCDLWRNTLVNTVPAGAIPRQIEYALSRLPAARQVKLYNSGSFFDPRAIPPKDYDAIASLVSGFERVIVECHPALVGDCCSKFQKRIGTRLEVAMGLETAHPEALAKLNKRMTVPQFAAAAKWLEQNEIALRTFLLVQPPFVAPEQAPLWARRSIDLAFSCSATAVTLIPTRTGNGALDQLAEMGDFTPPRLQAVEEALTYGLAASSRTQNTRGDDRPRVFADLWEIDRIALCQSCCDARVERLRSINQTQAALPRVQCSTCGDLS